jgi:hypothetical protein
MMAARRESGVVDVEPWNPGWATERAAEARLRESICLRRDGLPHTYPLHQQELETNARLLRRARRDTASEWVLLMVA